MWEAVNLYVVAVGALFFAFDAFRELREPLTIGIRPSGEVWGNVLACLGLRLLVHVAWTTVLVKAAPEHFSDASAAWTVGAAMVLVFPLILAAIRRIGNVIPVLGVALVKIAESIAGLDHALWPEVRRWAKRAETNAVHELRSNLRTELYPFWQAHLDVVRKGVARRKWCFFVGGRSYSYDFHLRLGKLTPDHPQMLRTLVCVLGIRAVREGLHVESGAEDRRGSPRASSDPATRVTVSCGSDTYKGLVLNESRTGAKLQLRNGDTPQFGEGDQVSVEFPDRTEQATAVWVRDVRFGLQWNRYAHTETAGTAG